MGTWDVGPFDNDTAADFGGDLDEVAAGERGPMGRVGWRALAREHPPPAERAPATALGRAAQPDLTHPDPHTSYPEGHYELGRPSHASTRRRHLCARDPRHYAPDPLGRRDDVRAAVTQACPEADLSDPAWGELSGPTWSVELNIGSEDPVDLIMLHTRGPGGDVLTDVLRLAEALRCRVLDCVNGDLITLGISQAGRNSRSTGIERSDPLSEPPWSQR
ncbi:DUF4259 domain-containing protein [Streptomyces sp. NBC_01565]|uniref:DUF4259 domain-containing protein n=1 Tax=unclassified Streptomyces TaxID=2593676 RepID=UPI0022567AE2|nr:DUF4259 domain-containing protein [Streptomyces sp. NBC_01565]MCX4539141.1 DUF4259 domain-containing protein [Streptomyces sp. NBC_01565]